MKSLHRNIDQLHLNYYDGICLRLQRKLRKLGNRHRSRKRAPATLSLSYCCFGSCPVGLLTDVVPRAWSGSIRLVA